MVDETYASLLQSRSFQFFSTLSIHSIKRKMTAFTSIFKAGQKIRGNLSSYVLSKSLYRDVWLAQYETTLFLATENCNS